MNIYKCDKCGTMVAEIKLGGCHPSCCGQPMTLIEAGTTDGAHEKHVPVCKVEGNKVTVEVGSVAHPMLEEHYIEWIAIETNMGRQRKQLRPGDAPKAEFLLLDGEELKEAYEYCNLHSLWKS
jgi:superoxide reductase